MEIKLWMIILTIGFLIWSYFAVKDIMNHDELKTYTCAWLALIGSLILIGNIYLLSLINWSFLEISVLKL